MKGNEDSSRVSGVGYAWGPISSRSLKSTNESHLSILSFFTRISQCLPSFKIIMLIIVPGIFTAPVKGVYYFSIVLFNAFDNSTGLSLMKNGEAIVSVSDNPPGADTEDTAGNSVSLLLEKGDRVYLELLENRKVYTDGWRRNTFSGHLLFTM